MKQVTKLHEFPLGVHLAALVFESRTIYTPGDQRSRDCPGHGYPESSEVIESIKYIAFVDDSQAIEWVKKQEGTKTVFKIISAKPLEVERTVTLHIKA